MQLLTYLLSALLTRLLSALMTQISYGVTSKAYISVNLYEVFKYLILCIF